MVPTTPLNINLQAWIVQDGNYADFVRGTVTEFALEALVEKIELASPGPLGFRHLAESRYQVLAQAVYVRGDVCVWDFGVLVYETNVTPRRRVGSHITAEVDLGVDPFFYSEEISPRLPDIPGLIYDWEVQRIAIQTAPWITAEKNMMKRDETQWAWRDIEATNAWEDDDGPADYLLTCIARSEPRRRFSRRPKHE